MRKIHLATFIVFIRGLRFGCMRAEHSGRRVKIESAHSRPGTGMSRFAKALVLTAFLIPTCGCFRSSAPWTAITDKPVAKSLSVSTNLKNANSKRLPKRNDNREHEHNVSQTSCLCHFGWFDILRHFGSFIANLHKNIFGSLDEVRKGLDRNHDGKIDTADYIDAISESKQFLSKIYSNLYARIIDQLEAAAILEITMPLALIGCLDAIMLCKSGHSTSQEVIRARGSLKLGTLQLSAAEATLSSARSTMARLERGPLFHRRSHSTDRLVIRLDSVCLGMHLANAGEELQAAHGTLRAGVARHLFRTALWVAAGTLNACAAGLYAAAGSASAAVPALLYLAVSMAAGGLNARRATKLARELDPVAAASARLDAGESSLAALATATASVDARGRAG